MFQFQTGSIKSVKRTVRIREDATKFQFQTGSIKSVKHGELSPDPNRFQFQTGSIKSLSS